MQTDSLAALPNASQAEARAAKPEHAAAKPDPKLDLVVAAQFVFAGRVGGAEHMLYNLLRGLGGECRHVNVLCAAESNLDPAALAELRGHPRIAVTECGGHGPRFLAEQWACLDPSLRGDAVLFPNYFVPPVTPRRLGRVVSVLHDMQYRHFPAYFSARKRLWLACAQHFAVRRADRLVVISDFVRGDVLRCFGAKFARKLVTVPNPISWNRFGRIGGLSRPLDRPYILSVAAQYEHKNLETLVRAFAEFARRDRDTMLVFCGQDYNSLRGVAGQRRGLAPLIQELGLEHRVHMTGYVDDAALGRWYSHATLFAFPSVFEGFGMPPVEALGFGLPTLTTRCTALPEVTLGLAHYVADPRDCTEWADSLWRMTRDPDRYRPATADRERIRRHYSPSRIAQLYVKACTE